MKRLNDADLNQMPEILESNGYPIVWKDGEYAFGVYGSENDYEVSLSAGGFISIKLIPPFGEKEYYFFESVDRAVEFINRRN